jgi:hypothetical protein
VWVAQGLVAGLAVGGVFVVSALRRAAAALAVQLLEEHGRASINRAAEALQVKGICMQLLRAVTAGYMCLFLGICSLDDAWTVEGVVGCCSCTVVQTAAAGGARARERQQGAEALQVRGRVPASCYECSALLRATAEDLCELLSVCLLDGRWAVEEG